MRGLSVYYTRERVLVLLLAIGYVCQYNPYFLAEYLWKNYWSGATIRTALSLTFASAAVLLLVFQGRIGIRRRPHAFVVGLVTTGLYGAAIGLLYGNDPSYIAADSLLWFETALYLFVLAALSQVALQTLIKFIVNYSVLAGVANIAAFWLVRNDIAIAALIHGEKIVRLVDLQAPLVLILLYFRPLGFSRRWIYFGTAVLLLEIGLGFFRSVWAAMILSMLLAVFSSPRLALHKRTIGLAAGLVVFTLVFEQLYFMLTGVNSALTGRIAAAIGSADSLGRLSSSADVLAQFLGQPTGVFFGHGLGAMAWFVNDFGDGEVLALQPVGSLSNYFIAILFEYGALWILFVLFPMALLGFRQWKSADAHIRRTTLILMSYVGFQWLTFPSVIHFPTTMTLAIGLSLIACRQAQSPAEGACAVATWQGRRAR